MKVLLALGAPDLTALFRKHLSSETDINLLDQDVMHRNYLNESISFEQPDCIVVHGDSRYLPSELQDHSLQDEELLDLIEHWRVEYPSLRVVMITIRDRHDPFLSNLVARNVLDVFNEASIDVERFLNQIKSPAQFKNVRSFGIGQYDRNTEEAKENPLKDDLTNEEGSDTTKSAKEKVSEKIRYLKGKSLKIYNFKKNSESEASIESVAADSNKDQDQEPEVAASEEKNSRQITRSDFHHSKPFNLITKVVKPKVKKSSRIIHQLEYQPLASKMIVVGSLYSNAGSTTVATNLARMIAKRKIDVAYVEHPLLQGYMYDYLQVHQVDPEYSDLAANIYNTDQFQLTNGGFKEHGISWYINDSKNAPVPQFQFEHLLYLSHSIKENIIIIDVSNKWLDKNIKKFLSFADEIILCVDPDPIKIDRSLYQISGFQTEEKKILDFLSVHHSNKLNIVMTKTFNGMDRKLFQGALPIKPLVEIPYIPYEDIQKSLYKSKLIYDIGYNEMFEHRLKPLIENILPSSLSSNTRKPKFFSRMF